MLRNNRLPLLAGIEDAGMQAAVAATSVHLADFTQKWISRGQLPASAFMYPKAEVSTKPWHGVVPPQPGQAGSRLLPCTSRRGRAGASMLGGVADRERHVYADRCSLLVVAFKLLQSLILKARQAEGSTQGLPHKLFMLACVRCSALMDAEIESAAARLL